MVREILTEDNQAESVPEVDAVEAGEETPAFVQYRGGHSSVSVDALGLHFRTKHRNNRIVHEPLPVVTREELREGDPPSNAVVLPVALELVKTNNLFGFGVACEFVDENGDVCGKVFDTKKQLDGHQSSHREDGDNEGEQ